MNKANNVDSFSKAEYALNNMFFSRQTYDNGNT